MESRIAAALDLKYNPVAIIWTDEKPKNALQFKEGKWGCVMWMFASAAKGKRVVFDRNTFGCWGGGVGLGFGNQYMNFPGSIECFYHFLSSGNENFELGKKVAERIEKFGRKGFTERFLRGERFMKSPELVKKFLELLPIIDIPKRYVVFKPLGEVDEKDEPVVIVFIVNPHQLSALIILAYYESEGLYNAFIPKGAGCHQIGTFAYREAESENPRAVVGITDLFARKNIRRMLGDNFMTFAVPFNMFQEMESNVEGSFLKEEAWKELLKRNSQ